MAQSADVRLEKALDNNEYSDADLVSIKQPTNLPYYNNSIAFQRLAGEVKIDGKLFRYVKCRIYNDSLELLCIPNKSRMSIEKSKDEFAKLVNDSQQGNSKKKSGPEHKQQKSFSPEFVEMAMQTAGNFQAESCKFYFSSTTSLSELALPAAERPPSANC